MAADTELLCSFPDRQALNPLEAQIQLRETVQAWFRLADERFQQKMKLMCELNGNFSAAAMQPVLEVAKISIPGFCENMDTGEARQQLIGMLWALDLLIGDKSNAENIN